MSAIFKCNDGNEHDFDSNTESEYCAKGCGEKWAIYAIKKLGADLKEKDAEIIQLKKDLTASSSVIDILKKENEQLKNYISAKYPACLAELEQLKKENIELKEYNNNCISRTLHEARVGQLESDLEIVRKTLEGQRAINDRQYDLHVKEIEHLKSKLKNIFLIITNERNPEEMTPQERQALKEIES